jgi:hypothetical protein
MGGGRRAYRFVGVQPAFVTPGYGMDSAASAEAYRGPQGGVHIRIHGAIGEEGHRGPVGAIRFLGKPWRQAGEFAMILAPVLT